MTRKPMQERGLKGVKIQKLPWGSLPLDLLEACAFGARLGNQSVFILDPRLQLLIIIAQSLTSGSLLRVLFFSLLGTSFFLSSCF